MGAISVAVVDNHPLIVDGVRNIFRCNRDYIVVATGRSLSDAFEIARWKAPDMLIFEPGMEGRSYDCISEIAKLVKTSVIVFTSLPGVEPAIRALDAGAKAYLLKSNPTDELFAAIAAVRSGETYVTPVLATKVIMALRSNTARRKAAQSIKLSSREEKIIQMLLEGRTNREIGLELAISEKTVKHYMTILMQKLHVRNRLEVLIAAQKMASDQFAGTSYSAAENVH